MRAAVRYQPLATNRGVHTPPPEPPLDMVFAPSRGERERDTNRLRPTIKYDFNILVYFTDFFYLSIDTPVDKLTVPVLRIEWFVNPGFSVPSLRYIQRVHLSNLICLPLRRRAWRKPGLPSSWLAASIRLRGDLLVGSHHLTTLRDEIKPAVGVAKHEEGRRRVEASSRLSIA